LEFSEYANTLAFLAKYQGLGENNDSCRSPIRDYCMKDVSRTQDNPYRDEQQTDHGHNVNVRYIWRQTDRPT
jgi:hypothetical protein